MVLKSVREKAFLFLIEKAKHHSKVRETCYVNIDGTSQYTDNRFTPQLIEILFKFRTRTYTVKNNFRNNYINTNLNCPLCKNQNDDQQHIFQCHIIKKHYNKPIAHSHDDIYAHEADILLGVAKEIRELVDIREHILNPDT